MKSSNNPLYLDFEFNQITHKNVNLVSCVTYDLKTSKKWWLHNSPKNQRKLAEFLKQHKTIIGYACVAEARSFISLGLDPLDFEWVDLFLEYRMLTNHNDRLQWGKQLVDGKVKRVSKPRPKWERDEGENQNGFKATHSLAEATYKLTGKIRDTKEKDETRKLIISDPKKFTDKEREKILMYNASDVLFLPRIWNKIKEEYKILLGGEKPEDIDMQQYFDEAILRGRYSAHTAIMETVGYPINLKATRNFSKQIPSILYECQKDINRQFKKSGVVPFKWNGKQDKFTWDQKVTREWLKNNVDISRWMMTKKSKRFPEGQISLALEAWERVFQFKHDYPRHNFGAQMVRFLKLKQSLYGFAEGGKKKTFWNSVGPDGRVRPYMNIYGAQSSRSQPGATGFMFLKPAWMRSLVEPSKGKFIAGVDYGQQEFFLSGLESGDKNMIQAYLSGDPYLYGAKLAGAIPKDGKKEDYKIERDLFKNTYLGILFGMTKYGLSIKLTNDLGRPFSEDEAQTQIELFEDTYPDYIEWRKNSLDSYKSGEGIRLPCGWLVGPDNDNDRSVLNVPIQGRGASIMRVAVDKAVVDKKCVVIKTLHDALYIEGDVGDEGKIVDLMDAMRDAFVHYYKGTKLEKIASNIKLDPFAWSPNYKRDSEITVRGIKIPVSDLYRDERAMNEYEIFSKYFEDPDSDLL